MHNVQVCFLWLGLKNHSQEQLGEERVKFNLQFILLYCEARTESRNVEAGAKAGAVEESCLPACFPCPGVASHTID